MLVSEGGAAVEVPEARDGASDGSGDGVFFNPTQELNRDVTVAVLRAYRDRDPRAASYLDAMAASGIRGVRAGLAGYDVTCADVDADAVQLAQANLARNDLDGAAVHRDVNALLHDEGPFDVVDIDPFGTPIPFVDSAFANTRDLVCVTATDTAPLCGAHYNSGVRKYATVPQNTEYHAEMGLRVLVSALVRTAARYDTAAVPVLSHVTRHYARTYLELDHRATSADSTLEELGYVYHCDQCLHREHEFGLVAHPPDECAHCGASVRTAGPIWLGAVRDAAFTHTVHDAVTDDMGEAKAARSLLETLAAEVETPTHYDQHKLCKQWGLPAPAMDEFVEALRAAGHEASRAHYHGTALKTTATVAEMRAATSDLF
ncbi:tRNA (guanine(26)-N(2))-dimethyltransferase [Salinigranum halophilum]|uniref:tRNA (guanine(26)-N(2))-dimethyltransferase n=1 Tax=Salinigranum halophilum TaxID=2565931 RepID=UPI00115CE620|nr:tRNA (guanine(26)-N(2))-dimethyltransferase [Salinigranum halophilum]